MVTHQKVGTEVVDPLVGGKGFRRTKQPASLLLKHIRKMLGGLHLYGICKDCTGVSRFFCGRKSDSRPFVLIDTLPILSPPNAFRAFCAFRTFLFSPFSPVSPFRSFGAPRRPTERSAHGCIDIHRRKVLERGLHPIQVVNAIFACLLLSLIGIRVPRLATLAVADRARERAGIQSQTAHFVQPGFHRFLFFFPNPDFGRDGGQFLQIQAAFFVQNIISRTRGGG
mmetsp:Transcript_42184/g.108638  ORF Transcript_42184/g.108638 Transcript_42184/m.108638 type:complete len:225 (-) Transcript_42184:314-988(-)